MPEQKKLTAKQEKFCQEIVAGKSQADAYRAAFQPKRASNKTIHEEASKIAAMPKVGTRISELMLPAIKEVQVTRVEWLKKMESYFYSDVRKMFDEFGNPIEIPQLGDHEAAMVEGFEFVEDYTKVKKGSGETEAVPTGYTKKYKLTPKLKAMLEFGKVMGWCDGETSAETKPPVNITINFVNTREATPPINITPSPVGVSFAKR